MEKYEIDREACILSAEILKNGGGFDFERQTIEEIADAVEGLGPANEKNGILERHYFNLSVSMYDFKILEAKAQYERDLKGIKPIKSGIINNEIAFIVKGLKN
jgi:hypothetical protein